MNTIIMSVVQSPLLQVSIALFLTTAGLFITAAVQHRLGRLTALVLSALMVVSIAMAAVEGTIDYIQYKNRIRLTSIEREAMAALAAGDSRDAYAQAVESAVVQSDRPASWLTAARAALLLGDLSAADYYYGRLLSMSGEELDEWGLAQTADELSGWSKIADLPGSDRREAAMEFSGIVQGNIESETEGIPDLDEAVSNHKDLLAIETLIHRAQDDPDSVVTDIDELDEDLEDLTGLTGAEGAREIRIDALIWQQQWDTLVDWLYDDGAQGLMDLADLVLDESIPQEELAQILDMDIDEVTDDFIEELADDLWDLRGRIGEDRAELYLTLARLYACEAIDDPDRALELIEEALGMDIPDDANGLAVLRELNSLRLWLETMDSDQMEGLLSQWSGDIPSGKDDAVEHTTPEPSVTPIVTPEATEEPWPEELSGDNIRLDFAPMFNICAPEMIQAGRIRFYVTMAEGSGGFPEGEPTASDFAFRTNIGFQRLLSVNSMALADAVETYTMLLIDRRPSMTAEALDLARTAALAYVRSMPEGEKVLIYSGGVPTNFICPAGSTLLFGNSETETFLFSSDKDLLEQFILADYGGDVFSNPDMNHMLSWALNQMTAISPDGVSGDLDSFPLTAATPRFGQVIVFTNGDSGGGVSAGGDKSLDYVRGAAIAANAAIHIVGIDPVADDADLTALAEAGRGSYIDPSVDSLTAFYNFIRNRRIRVFLADCAIPEDPVDEFFELWAQHTPTGVMAGFMRNPGRGVDLIGTLHYSDASLSSADFHDYTGDDLNGSTGGDPFADTGDDEDDGSGDQSDGQDTGQSDGQDWDTDVTDWPGADSLRVDGLDRHTVARNDSGLILVNLLGQGFNGLSESDIHITFPGLGTLQTTYIDITDDYTIRFFLPVTMPTGMYSMRVVIGGRTFDFPDTLWVYDADNFTVITFGEWTITAASAQEAGDGDWVLSSIVINDYMHFTGQTLISGDWLTDSADELTLDPAGEAYIAFDPESSDYFVQEFFIEEGADLVLGSWNVFTLERLGDSAPFSSRQWGDVLSRPLTFGIIEMPYDTGTLYTDHVEVPILDLNLNLPLQRYLFIAMGKLACSASADAMFTADIDSFDLALTAGLKTDQGLKFMGALRIKEFVFEIDTAVHRIAVDLGVQLIKPDDEFSVHVAMKGRMLDEITVSVETEIPVTTTPIPVTLSQLGGGLENLAAITSGDPMDILGITMVGIFELKAGKATDLLPFLGSMLPASVIPPVLATDNAELKLRPWPFSLTFETDVKLCDTFPVGHAELAIGYYAFNQTLLGISDDEAVGLHALIGIGPDIDFKIVRLGYRAGPSLDINNHGVFVAATGAAWFGVNLGPIGFTADMNGTFLIAIHGIEDSDLPQLSIVANAAPTAGIPLLWEAGEEKDVRLLINEYGIRIVGIPSPLDEALDWMDEQITAAADETWEAVTDGMDALADAAEAAWDLAGDGVDAVDAGLDAMTDAMTDGLGTLYDTGSEVIDDVDDFMSDMGDAAGEAGDAIVDFAEEGYSGFTSTVEGAYNFLF